MLLPTNHFHIDGGHRQRPALVRGEPGDVHNTLHARAEPGSPRGAAGGSRRAAKQNREKLERPSRLLFLSFFRMVDPKSFTRTQRNW